MINEKDLKKYYQPDISEFHVGFECEYKEPNTEEWLKDTLNNSLVSYLLTYPENARVKFLDKEDIESLGFKKDSMYSHKYKNDYYIEYNSETPIHLDTIEIKNNQLDLFRGYIKNKSELKRLLKQLNIK